MKKFIFIVLMFPVSCFAAIGVEVTPNSWNAGTGGAGNFPSWTSATPIGDGFFTVTNLGDESAAVSIRTTNTQNWTLGNSPGLNQYAIQWGRTLTQGTEPDWNSIGSINSAIVSLIGVGSNFKFDLRFQSPSQIDPVTLTDPQENIITISVASPLLGIWDIKDVDSGDTSTSIAVDTIGNAHIAYRQSSTNNLKYARWTGLEWSIETVDSLGLRGKSISLKLDENNIPHISYTFDENSGTRFIKYATRDGSSWDIRTVDFGGGFINTSIVLDLDGNPHIAYAVSTQLLRHAKWTGSLWNIEDVDGPGTVGVGSSKWVSMAIDSNNNPRIAYRGESDQSLRYARFTGSFWDIQTVDSIGDTGHYASLKLDISDNPQIAYRNNTIGELKHAQLINSSWVTQTVDSSDFTGFFSSLDLDTVGNPSIAYFDGTNQDLLLATLNGSLWEIQIVDSIGNVGHDISFDLDSNNLPHIAYRDFINARIKYARFQ